MSICFTFIPGEAACEVAVDMQTDNKSQLIRNALTGLFAVTVLALNLAALTRLEHTEELEEVYQAFGRMPFVLFLAVGLGRSALSFIHRKADRAAALNHLLFGAAALIGAANLYVRGNNPSSFQFTGTVYLAAIIISRIFAFRRAHSKKAVAFLILQILLLLICMILPFIFAVFFIDMQALFSIVPIAFARIRMDILKKIIRRTYAAEILFGIVLLIVAFSLILPLFEESISGFGDGLWYCFAIVTTIGFGDIYATSVIGRILSVILGIYGIVVVSLITSIIVNFYGEMRRMEEDDDEV